LPDVETVCDHVVVLGRGSLLAQGRIQELKQLHQQSFEVRLKGGQEAFVDELVKAGCTAEPRDDLLLVEVPEGQTQALIWQTAARLSLQIRHLRQHRSTLEDVFLKAVAE
jgi:ABC-type uncharacterized transport system ATPase subunit